MGGASRVVISGVATSGAGDVPADALDVAARRAGRRKLAAQVSLFDLANEKVIAELREADLETLTPEEAKELLRELRKKAL